MSERKLRAWQEAGLIDTATADSIRAWEATHARTLGTWAIMALGALTIGLGIISVVAANWDLIPGEVRLAAHLGLISALSVLLWWSMQKPERSDHISDAGLFVLAMLGLTFFAHVGQVYQTSSPLWQPILAWIILFTPVLLAYGQGWSIAALWTAGVLVAAWFHADQYQSITSFRGDAAAPALPWLYWGLISSPPMAIAALAAIMGKSSARPDFWRGMEVLAMAIIIAGLSGMIIVTGWDGRSGTAFLTVVVQCLALAGAALGVFLSHPTASGRARAGILIAAALLHFIFAGIIQWQMEARNPWICSAFFLMLWGAVAVAALYAHWRGVFQLAIGVIAARIMILSFELNDDLLTNGLGLIVSGLLAIVVAWAATRISRRFAPARKGQS